MTSKNTRDAAVAFGEAKHWKQKAKWADEWGGFLLLHAASLEDGFNKTSNSNKFLQKFAGEALKLLVGIGTLAVKAEAAAAIRTGSWWKNDETPARLEVEEIKTFTKPHGGAMIGYLATASAALKSTKPEEISEEAGRQVAKIGEAMESGEATEESFADILDFKLPEP